MAMQIRVLDSREVSGFAQYLLPDTQLALRRKDPSVLALGAVLGVHSCGAVAARLDRKTASLTDLFIDAAARRCGVGERLLTELLERLQALGVRRVEADYAAAQPDCEALDALLMKVGFSEPRRRSLVFRADTGRFHDNRWVKAAFSPGYHTPPSVQSFDMLSERALESLNNAGITPVLSYESLKDSAEPTLSVALVRDGDVCAYLLARESADGGCALLSAVRLDEAPIDAILVLLRELLNRCYYRLGGDFPLYFSTLSPRAEALALRLTAGRATLYEEHVCYRINPQYEKEVR
jgi:ribosomal protein S18 acetylase RimI-like enzyme